jgi:alpha-glucoside transport system substrate-binding protein
MRKLVTIGLLVTLLVTTFASCTPAPASQPAQPPKQEQPTQKPADTQAPIPQPTTPPAVQPTQPPVSTGKTIEILGPWGGLEQEALMKVIKPFEDQSGITINYTGTRDVSLVKSRSTAGNPPDFYISPLPSITSEFAADNRLVALDSFMDMSKLKAAYPEAWLSLATNKDHLYGVFGPVTIKSIVWYNPANFKAKGYVVPTTWDEMVALSDKMVKDGNVPWAVAMGSGDATGWPGTDWVEDIMLRTVGTEGYDKWVNHEIPWTDPAVKSAWETFGKIALNPKYVYGGTQTEIATDFGDGADPVFSNPPKAYMHRQALFEYDFIRKHFPDLKPLETVDFFQLPSIDPKYGNPAEAGGEMLIMFKDTPENRQFMNYWAGVDAQKLIAVNFGRLSANKEVPSTTYSDPLLAKGADLLAKATAVRFDGSDLMPSAIGAGSFWTGIVDYIKGKKLDDVLKTIEEASVDAYTK